MQEKPISQDREVVKLLAGKNLTHLDDTDKQTVYEGIKSTWSGRFFHSLGFTQLRSFQFKVANLFPYEKKRYEIELVLARATPLQLADLEKLTDLDGRGLAQPS